MNLEERLREISWRYSDFWNYYQENLEFCMDENTAKKFICDYFQAASKENVVTDWLKIIGEDDRLRYTHSVIAFFIGILLQHTIDKNMCVITEERGNNRYPFSYLWFLTCLAHDIGYQCEIVSGNEIKNMQSQLMKRSNYRTNILLENYAYQQLRDKKIVVPHSSRKSHCRFGVVGKKRRVPLRIRGERGYSFRYNDSDMKVKPWYSDKLENDYFKYRFWCMDVVDHGIAGADYLYEKLCQNYEEQYKDNRATGNHIAFYNEDGNYFSESQKEVYAYIADCVAAHNIFKAENSWDLKKLYMSYNLGELLPENFRKIDYKMDPLLFILCIADTIEPIKRFSNCKDVLKKVDFDFHKDNNTLLYYVDENLGTDEERRRYINGVETLSEWCNVSVKKMER